MIFRRQESFRYTFNEPIDCLFKLTKIDGTPTNSEYGKGQIIDISPSGLKMMTTLNLSPSLKMIEIEIQFSIDDSPFQILGIIQWQKKDILKNGYLYGVKLDSTAEIAASIIKGLKRHAEKTCMLKNSNNNHSFL